MMKNKDKEKHLISLTLNIVIVVLDIIAILNQLLSNDTTLQNANGINIFRYFTNDGNIFAMIVAIINIVYISICIIKNKNNDSKIIYIFNLMSSVTLFLIFLVVVIILAPISPMLVSGYNMIIEHVVVPFLCVCNFLFLTNNKISKKMSLIGSLPLLLYGVIAIILCLTKVWTNELIPYPFLDIYNNPIWMTLLYAIGIIGGSFFVSILFNFSADKLFIFKKTAKEKRNILVSLIIIIILLIIYVLIYQVMYLN